jgi:hypothetical protein
VLDADAFPDGDDAQRLRFDTSNTAAQGRLAGALAQLESRAA